MSVIFVAGVHGVGKTSACECAAESLGISHFTASEIILARKSSVVATEGKVVKDLDENQQILMDGVRQTLAMHSPILLDGHFTLRTIDGIVPIAPSVFSALPIRAVALFHDAPEKIVQRLNSRDNFTHDVADVSAHQEAELKHACEVSKLLGIPLAHIPAFDTTTFVSTVSMWLER